MAARELFSSILHHRTSSEMINQSDYNYAHALLAGGNFSAARERFSAIRHFGDSETMILESYYRYARYLFERGNYMEAREILSLIHPYGNSEEFIIDCYYHYAMQLLFEDRNFEAAKSVIAQAVPYESLIVDPVEWLNIWVSSPFEDWENGYYEDDWGLETPIPTSRRNWQRLLREANYQYAWHLLDTGNPQDARSIFVSIHRYQDAVELIREIDYDEAMALRRDGHQLAAYRVLRPLGYFRDSQEQREEIRHRLYDRAVRVYREGDFDRAEEIFGYTSGIGRTSDFMTLLRARRGQWAGNGSGLLDLLDFEDTTTIINGNDTLLRNFLGQGGQGSPWGLGRSWSNAAGYDITFTDGRMSWSLPTVAGTFDFAQVRNGIRYRVRGDDWVRHWEYTIISLNQIRVHNFYNGRNYTLNRSN